MTATPDRYSRDSAHLSSSVGIDTEYATAAASAFTIRISPLPVLPSLSAPFSLYVNDGVVEGGGGCPVPEHRGGAATGGPTRVGPDRGVACVTAGRP
jgi:hypothetical protein